MDLVWFVHFVDKLTTENQKPKMDYFFRLAVTGKPDDISLALNAIDDRLIRDGSLRRTESCFRCWKASRKNDDGTMTSYFSTYQAFATNWLNGSGVNAQIVERG